MRRPGDHPGGGAPPPEAMSRAGTLLPGFAECRLPELPAVLDHRPKLQLDQALRVTSANRHAGSSLHRYARRLVEDPDLLAMRFDPDREHTGGAE